MKKFLNFNIEICFLKCVKFVLLMGIFFVFNEELSAQVDKHESSKDENYSANKFIVFGQSINDYTNDLNDQISWSIQSEGNQKVMSSGEGNTLANYKFNEPGKYIVKIDDQSPHDLKSCGHSKLPNLIHVEVSGTEMIYDFARIKFSEKITKGKRCDQIVVSVPIRVKLVDDKPVVFNIPNITTAGIGTEIIAIPEKKHVELVNGEQVLTFRLSGVANNEAYIMFDFVDVNNQVQSYSHLEFIK